MAIEKTKATNQQNLVSSFITAFVGVSGPIEGVCIKFSMLDGTTRLSHWAPHWVQALHQCVEYYSAKHYYGSDLQRAAEEPDFASHLPKRHPVRTMAGEKPDLSEEDYQVAQKQFSVALLKVVDEGAACRIECTYLNGTRSIHVLPAYIAMNLCAALKATHDTAALLVAEPGGTA